MRMVGKGDTQNKGGGPTVQAARDAVVLDEELQRAAARQRAAGPAGPPGQRPARLPQGPGEVGGHLRDRARPAPATPWPATRRSSRPTARSRCSAAGRSASTPAARRSSPRRSSPPSRRTPRCSTPSSSACPTSAGASGWPRSCSPGRAPRPPSMPWTPTAVGTLRGTRSRRSSTSSTRWSAPPAASPTTRGPPRSPGARSTDQTTKGDSHAGPREALHRRRVGRPRRLRRHRGHLPPHRRGRGPGARGHHRRHRPRRGRRPHRVRRGRVAPHVARGAHRRRAALQRPLRRPHDGHGADHHHRDGLADQLLPARPGARRRG